MSRKKIYLKYKKERAILSDVLPYEIPVTFSNRHYYDFLLKYKVRFLDRGKGNIEWRKDDAALDAIIRLLFGVDPKVNIQTENRIELGRPLSYSSFATPDNSLFVSIPFSFKISHKEKDHRELAICHPKSQLQLIDLYDQFKELILYYCSVSPFSIRRPVKTSKFIYHRDRTHYQRLSRENATIEEFTKEYESLRSFFVYKDYSNIYKFYESYRYHRSEQKYNGLLKLDVSKCFDNLYTHSLSWALLGKEVAKANLKASKGTFPGRLDRFMACLNYNETNGIIIGPEFSRIFAELIFQQIDKSVAYQLMDKHNLRNKVNYEIFRYIDDYFIFYNDDSDKDKIQEILQVMLRNYKLSLNSAKAELYKKPIITNISIAKLKIADLLSDALQYRFPESQNKDDLSEENEEQQKEQSTPRKTGTVYIDSNRLITKFKIVLKESNVEYKDMQNYSLAVVERKSVKLLSDFQKLQPDADGNHERQLITAIINILDFSFFIYSVSPRVNTTIKLCRLIKLFCDFLKPTNANADLRHLVFKTIYDKSHDILKKYKNQEHTQIETLYLVLALSELGKDYLLEEDTLCEYYGIDKNQKQAKKFNLNYFSITVLLCYIKKNRQYAWLRKFIESQIKEKFVKRELSFLRKDTEHTLLLLDTLTCPYITDKTKRALLTKYEIKDYNLQSNIIGKRQFWFTRWTDFDLAKELDAKRSSEVY